MEAGGAPLSYNREVNDEQDDVREHRHSWEGFVADVVSPLGADELRSFAHRRVLITGAGGYLGSALARALAAARVAQLVLLDIAEFGLYRLQQELAASGCLVEAVFLVGDVCDESLLREIFARHRPEIVFHAAALKHVPLMEANALAAAQTNVLGTASLVRAGAQAAVASFVLLSTDKAVEPISVMGASKRMAEQIVLRERQDGRSAFKVIRLCNVLGSTGSVAPHFARQIEAGGPLTVSHSAATRFFLSRADAVRLVLRACLDDSTTDLLVPRVGPARRIEELARYLLRRDPKAGAPVTIAYTGLRPADKLHEQLVGSGETETEHPDPAFVGVQSPFSESFLQVALDDIKGAVATRDRSRLRSAMQKSLPEYLPQTEQTQAAGGVHA